MKWPEANLTSICSPRQWPTISGNELTEAGYPVYGANGRIGFYHSYNHERPTVLITCRGATCGTINICEPKSYVTGNAMALDEPDSNIIDFKFLYFALIARTLNDTITGAAQPQITRANLARVKVPLPSLAEQRLIVELLEQADALRCRRAEADALADSIFPALFRKMFANNGNTNGWRSVRLGEVTAIDAPMVDPRQPEFNDLIHIGPDRIESRTGRLLPALTAREEGLISGKFLFDERHVLYSKIRPYLRKVALPEGRGLCSADMYPVMPLTEHLTREYLCALLLSDSFTNYTAERSGRASIPKVNREEFAAYQFPLPPLPLQRRFSNEATQLRKLMTDRDHSRENIEKLFSILLHHAFTGELTARWREAHVREVLTEMEEQARRLKRNGDIA